MGFEIFVQSFSEGVPAGISREQLRSAFDPHLTEAELGLWVVRYDDENWCDLYLSVDKTAPDLVDGFMVSRPCSDPRLWDSLASILRVENAVLFWPDGPAPVVGDSSAVAHLPSELVEVLGEPVVVSSGQDIVNLIRSDNT